MSRSAHKLKSEQWYGDWAAYIRADNRADKAIALRSVKQRDARVDAEQLTLELAQIEADAREDAAAWLAVERETSEERDNWAEYLGGVWSYDEDPWYGDDTYDDDTTYYAEVCPCATCVAHRREWRGPRLYESA